MARISQVLFAVCFLYLLSKSAVRSYEWNQDLVDNEVEGERLVEEIREVQANTCIADSDKRILQTLGDTRYGSRSKGCCKTAIQPVRRTQYYSNAYDCGYYYSYSYITRCGWWGWWTCKRTQSKYRRNTCYRSNSYNYYVPGSCQTWHKTCCQGYFWYGNNCMSMARVQSLLNGIREKCKTTTTATPTTTTEESMNETAWEGTTQTDPMISKCVNETANEECKNVYLKCVTESTDEECKNVLLTCVNETTDGECEKDPNETKEEDNNELGEEDRNEPEEEERNDFEQD